MLSTQGSVRGEFVMTHSDKNDAANADDVLLDICELRTWFDTDEGLVKAVDGVTYRILKGETLGVVGESGCGKSVTAMSILQLIPTPPGRYAGGEIRFKGRDLLSLPEAELRKVRGNDIAMIFQEPMTSLNPVYTVGDQIMEALILHRNMSSAEAYDMAIAMLEKVGIPSPEVRVDEYPHQMSGGMKQRVMIAMALACDPALLIADEPTTALDVTIQAQILELLREMQKELGMSILLITHDLGVVAGLSDHVAVMYAGKVVEYADVETLFAVPRHPYTYGLFQSLPEMHGDGDERLREIPGTVPNPLHFPSGCKFRTRCFKVTDQCATNEPSLVDQGAGHQLACHHPMTDEELAAGGHMGEREATR
ncbi:MAG: oligopeptide/dipeptide ABC transporter ATP-binding protein [Pseudohongiellaceae bacterium]|jgi:oligopeptide/dipeptide ABC transporter ATP-binding protein